MDLGYRIIFAGGGLHPEVHRIRNFAEDLHRRLQDEKLGKVPNMDSAVNEVVVAVESRRHLGPALKAIRQQLKRSKFGDNVSVERLQE